MDKEDRFKICCICGKEYSRRSGLYKHISVNHKIKTTEYWNIYYSKNKSNITDCSLLTCHICGENFNSYTSLGLHISRSHHITTQDYYDRFYKTKDMVCKECGKDTKFLDLRLGYRIFCSTSCLTKNQDIKEKIKNTCLKNYGVENPSQSEIIKEKKKDTCLHSLGTEYPMQSINVQEKSKITCLKNYGVECSLNNKDVIKKAKSTRLEKYGDENYSNRPKSIKTCLDRLGTEYPMQNKEVHEKAKSTCLKNHNTEYPMKNIDIQEKAKKTCLQRYGAEKYALSKQYREKQEALGLMIPLDQLSEYKRYRRLVTIETYKNKKDLYSNWDGTDYYTGEKLITTEEFKKLYPEKSIYENKLRDSVDHKLSVSYCFENNISAKECSRLENLCICSMFNNTAKNYRNEDEFKKILEEQKLKVV